MKNYPFFFILIITGFTACFPVRALFLGAPDIKDGERFTPGKISKPEEAFNFYASKEDWTNKIKVNDHTTNLPVFRPIEAVLDDHKSRAFLLIKNDSILLEYYRQDINDESLHPSYSVAKAFTSALTGFAIQDGFLESEEELVVKYIPELEHHPESKTLKISHLLNMTSGIGYTLPQDAFIYYGKDSWKGINAIKFNAEPGEIQQYVNMNIHLLGLLLSRATKMPLRDYLTAKIWQPLGMESNAHWSMDEKNGIEKAYCCLNATARDYAKFGRLFLEGGNWNGQQILNENWIEKSIRRDTSQGSSYNYNYCWHIGLEAYGDYYADGMYKQFIYINPRKKIIMVLLNEKERKIKSELVNWPYIFRQIVDQL